MIDQDLTEFIVASVPSVWALELLLFLRARPGEVWSADALVRELRASQTVVGEALARFETGGLIRCEPDGCAYAPASPVLAQLCDRLAELYRVRPVAVVNTISRSRAASLQSFADAFRLKDPK